MFSSATTQQDEFTNLITLISAIQTLAGSPSPEEKKLALQTLAQHVRQIESVKNGVVLNQITMIQGIEKKFPDALAGAIDAKTKEMLDSAKLFLTTAQFPPDAAAYVPIRFPVRIGVYPGMYALVNHGGLFAVPVKSVATPAITQAGGLRPGMTLYDPD